MRDLTVWQEEVLERLETLPNKIMAAECAFLNGEHAHRKAKLDLAADEAALWLSQKEDGTPVLDGKNADARAAQLLAATMEQAGKVEDAWYLKGCLEVELNRLKSEFSAAKAMARLLAGGE